MGLISNGVEKSKIKPGDHIYTWRAAYTYSHHGIYVGGSKVAHFTREQAPGDASSSLGSSFSSSGVSSLSSSSIPSNFSSSASTTSDISSTCPTFPDCGFRQPNSGVVLSCVDCFLGNGNLYCFEYGVHPSFFLAKFRGGTCTTAKSDPPELVIHRAMFLFQKGFGNYNVFENNCEDFALYCKTGLLIPDKLSGMGISGQAASAFGAPLAALISSPLRFLMPSPVGVAIVTSGMYCVSRYATDIGVRTDVIKVAVEDMSVKLGWVGPSSNEVAEDKESSDRRDDPNNALGTSSVTGKHKKSRYATDIDVHKDATMVAMEGLSVNLSSAGRSGKEVAEDKESSNRLGPKNGSGTSSFMSMYSTYMGVHKDALKGAMEDISVNFRSVGRTGKEVVGDKEDSNRLAPKNDSGTSSFSGKHKKSW